MKQTNLFNPRQQAASGSEIRERKRLPADEYCPWPDCGADMVELVNGGFICMNCGRGYHKGAQWQNYHTGGGDGYSGCGRYITPDHGCGCGTARKGEL